MDFLERIGNLVSGRGFTSNKEKDEEEKRRRAQSSRPSSTGKATPSSSRQSSKLTVSRTVADPEIQRRKLVSGMESEQPTELEALQARLRNSKPALSPVEGITPETWAKMPRSVQENLTKTQASADLAKGTIFSPNAIVGDVGRTVVSGLQQSAGTVADIALMGGNMLSDAAAASKGASQEERAAIYNRFNKYRDVVKDAKTVAGTSLNPQEDFQFTGDLGRDAANLTGRSLRVGLDATQFINPTRAFTTGATKQVAAKEALKFVGRDSLLYGTGETLATGAQVYGETGDIAQAAGAGIQAGATSAVTQTGLDLAGTMLGTGARKVADGTTQRALQSEAQMNQAQAVAKQVEQAAAQVPEVVPVAKGVGSKNLAKAAKSKANEAVVQAKAVEQEAIVKTAQAVEDAEIATKVADELEKPKADEGDIPFIETPRPEKKPTKALATKDADFVSKEVQAAQERVDYLKREMAPQAEIRKAEAELAAAKSAVAEVKKAPVEPNLDDGFANVFTAKDGRKVAMVHPPKTKAPKVVESTVVAPAPELKLNKGGTVNNKWYKDEIKRITESDMPPKAKTEALSTLTNKVKQTEGEIAKAKQIERDKSNPDLTKKQKTARANVAEVDVPVKVKAKARRKAVKESGAKIAPRKNKAGGKVTSMMARQANFSGDPNARMALDSASPKTVKSHKVTQAAAAEKAYSSSIDDIIDDVNKTDANSMDYQKSADLIAYSNRLSEEVGDLAAKKKLSAKEKAKLERIRETQVDLYDKVAESESDAARSTSYLGYLYKQLDPALVAKRAAKKMEDAGAPYSLKQKEVLNEKTRTLQQRYNEHDASVANIEDLRGKLGKGDEVRTPEQVRADLSAELDGLKAKEDSLRAAYDDINIMTKKHWDAAVKKGDAIESKTYGFGVNKYQKLNMLSGVFGRVRDMGTTGATYMDVFVDDVNRALTGKLFNTVRGTKKFDSVVFPKGGATGRGIKEGIRKTVATFTGKEDTNMGLDAIAGGKRKHAPKSSETDRLIIDSEDMGKTKLPKTGLRKAVSVPANIIRGAVAMPSHLLGETYKARALNRAGLDAARKLGLSGDDAKLYARSMEMNPTQAVKDAAEYTSKEISGLQAKWSKDIDGWYRNALYKYATWDGNKSVPGWRAKRAGKMAAGAGITAAKNTVIPFTSWPLGTGKNIVQRQSILLNYFKAGKRMAEAIRNGDDAAANAALTHFARGNYNVAKLGVTLALFAPLLSDDDANGDGYSPPYIKIQKPDGTYWSNDLSILGPLSAPLINVWAYKKAQEAAERGDDPASAYFANLGSGILNKVGLAGTLNGQGVPILDTVTEIITSPFRDPESKGSGLQDSVVKAIGDVASQSIPLGSLQRDINSVINLNPEFQLSPQTKVMNDDGSTNWVETTARQLGSTFVGVNQMMEDNDEGKVADSPFSRVIGAKEMNQAAQDKEKTIRKLNESLNDVLGDDKLRSLLDDDVAKVYDKAGKKKLTTKEVETVRNELIKGAEKVIEENDYESYIKVKRLQEAKINEDRTSSDSDKKKIKHEITVAETLRDNKFEYSLYKMYAKGSKSDGSDEDGLNSGISESELKKMVDPESDYYNPELANKLIDIDQKMAKAGVSDNSLDSTVPKYDLDKVLNRKSSGGSGGGRGGGGGSKMATDIGTFSLSSMKTVSNPALKYRALDNYNSPIPNLSAQVAKTNLKKSISVQKGVKLG